MIKTVLHVSDACCIRVVKETYALGRMGVNCPHFFQRVSNDDLTAMLTWMNVYASEKDFRAKITTFEGIDVFHVHNEPNWMVSAIREECPEAAIIMDCHDLDSMRGFNPAPDEVGAMEAADGFIFPSYSYMDAATKLHSLGGKPKIVIYSACPSSWQVKESLPRVGGVVYEGGLIAIPDNVDEEKRKRWQYRDVRDLTKEMTKQGVPLTIIPSFIRDQDEYLKVGALCTGPMPYRLMLLNLSRFDWGIFGTLEPHPQIRRAMPNKLFEYMAAGIPIIAINADETGEYVEKHGIGISVTSVNDIKEKYHLHKECRRNVMAVRESLAMETQVALIRGLYEAVKRC